MPGAARSDQGGKGGFRYVRHADPRLNLIHGDRTGDLQPGSALAPRRQVAVASLGQAVKAIAEQAGREHAQQPRTVARAGHRTEHRVQPLGSATPRIKIAPVARRTAAHCRPALPDLAMRTRCPRGRPLPSSPVTLIPVPKESPLRRQPAGSISPRRAHWSGRPPRDNSSPHSSCVTERKDSVTLGFVAAVIFFIAFLINATSTATSAVFSR